MKATLCLGTFALVLMGGARDSFEMTASYPAGSTLSFEGETSKEMTAGDVTVSVNGQELPPEIVEQFKGEMSLESTDQSELSVLSEVVEGGDEPTSVKRTWDTMRKSKTSSEGDEESVSVLEGRSLLLTLEDGEVLAEVADDGEELDDETLENHQLTEDVDSLLPDEEVSVGDSWELDDETAERIYDLVPSPRYYDDDDSEGDEEFSENMREHADLTLEVTFASIKEVDGATCAVLTFRGTMVADLDELPSMFRTEDGPEVEGTLALDLELTGELVFNLDSGHAVETSQELTGAMDISMEFTQEMEGQELDIAIEIESLMDAEREGSWSRE